MPKKIDLVGRIFGRLSVTGPAASVNERTMWICQCTCGKTTIKCAADLSSGHTKSCGCWRIEMPTQMRTTHNKSTTVEYRTWTAIKTRCYNKNVRSYKDYGQRGITVCERWLNSFTNFYEDMGPKPSKFHSIERADSNGEYGPSNCYWGTDDEQRHNKRNNRWLEYKGKKMLMEEWSSIFGVMPSTLYEHLVKRGKPFDQIVKFYINKKGIVL